MTPFDLLGALLERIHARSPVAAYVVAVAIAAACALTAAYLNQDGVAVVHTHVRKA
ncbi:MAG: hypothetical protein VB131_04190 [Burkholderia gladioli]